VRDGDARVSKEFRVCKEFRVSKISFHPNSGGLRTSLLPSAEIDANGRAYVAWEDCRFEPKCAANDIVLSSSNDGANWSAVSRIPIDDVGSGVDHSFRGWAWIRPRRARARTWR
jgi:hypothetical protein